MRDKDYLPRYTWTFPKPASEPPDPSIRIQGMPINSLLSQLLEARQLFCQEEVDAYLSPSLMNLHDPFLMRDMDKAVERLATAIREKQAVAIFGDYDVDGLTATAFFVRLFKWAGLDEVYYYVPDRLEESYGLSPEGIDDLHKRGTQLIITTDNGIGCCEEITYAREKYGIDVIITDHHRPGPELPEAVAVVNPHRDDCDYPFPDLSGVAVAFKVACGLVRHLDMDSRERNRFLISHLYLVALGTVADVMPLRDENRILVHHGLKVLNDMLQGKSEFPCLGLIKLIQKLTDDSGDSYPTARAPLRAGQAITEDDIGHIIAPRLNAAGRTGNVLDAYKLLVTEDGGRAEALATLLNEYNQKRREWEKKAREYAIRYIEEERSQCKDEPVLVVEIPMTEIVAHEEISYKGVLGIVASRLIDLYGKPALVIGMRDEENEEPIGKGSGRSCGSFDLYKALCRCEDYLDKYGGHQMAAGFNIQFHGSYESQVVDDFRQKLIEEYDRQNDEDIQRRPLFISAQAHINDLSPVLLEHFAALRPFGQENPFPLIMLKGCSIVSDRTLTIVGKNHLKLQLRQDLPAGNGKTLVESRVINAIWFRCPHIEKTRELLLHNPRFSVVGSIYMSHYNRALEFKIKDLMIEDSMSDEIPSAAEG
ncbi:MAG: single-stranded-DNA-specific exonuclease RecJ [Candidatus Sumerlaeia bacterium]